MEHDPQIPPYSTSDGNSFASVSAQRRWPVILTGAIDDVHRSVAEQKDEEAIKEGKTIVEALAKLKYEVQHDRELTPLEDDGQPDIKEYNDELQQRGQLTWQAAPWLYAECYLYRRLATYFNLSTKWKGYDVFARQKLETFQSSRPAVIELAERYKEIIQQLSQPSSQTGATSVEAEEVLFSEMCEICLWGNATDLSLLTNLSYEDIQKLQGSKARKAAEKNILVNDLPKVFALLKQAQKDKPAGAERRVDIVLDNAGFELFVDLVLAGYLVKSGLATNVVLHPKDIPWFVSDVMPKDFAELLNALRDPQAFYTGQSTEAQKAGLKPSDAQLLTETEAANLEFLFSDWAGLHAEGQLTIRPNSFWTAAGSYWRMPFTAPRLYEDLRQSEVVIFKGDLNGRKLAGDCVWPASVPFAESLGPLAKPGAGLKILELRTCKADVVVGLPEGEDERLRALEGGGGDSGARKWAWTGKWAVVLFSDAS